MNGCNLTNSRGYVKDIVLLLNFHCLKESFGHVLDDFLVDQATRLA